MQDVSSIDGTFHLPFFLAKTVSANNISNDLYCVFVYVCVNIYLFLCVSYTFHEIVYTVTVDVMDIVNTVIINAVFSDLHVPEK